MIAKYQIYNFCETHGYLGIWPMKEKKKSHWQVAQTIVSYLSLLFVFLPQKSLKTLSVGKGAV